MPDQLPPRRRFRLLRWSLFGLALVGLGFLLQDWLSPLPRCTIVSPTPVRIDALSPEGTTLVTLPQDAGGGIRAGPPLGPLQVWDTTSGQLTGSYLEVKAVWHHDYSARKRYLAAMEDSKPVLLHLIDLSTQGHKQIRLKEFCEVREIGDLSFSPCDGFLLWSDEKTTCLMDTATGEIVKSIKPGLAPLAVLGFTPDDGLLLFDELVCVKDVEIELSAHGKVLL